MSKKVLAFILIFSLGLIVASLYIISTIDPGVKPKPTAEVVNVTALDIKVNDQFKLQYTDGKEFSFANLQNKFTLIYFGFTHCPDICPATLVKMKEAISMLSAQELDRLQFIFVSIDPARDTMLNLHQFVSQFDDHIQAVTGSQEELDKLALSLKAYYAKNMGQVKDAAGEHGDYYVDHSSFIYLLNPKVELISQFTPNALAEDLAKQIKIKVAE